jgi:hypothetical protein
LSEGSKGIEAEKFVLRDLKGRRRAELGIQSDDNPELLLLSDREQPQARFSITASGTNLELLNRQGIVRLRIRAGLDDSLGASPSITLFQENGESAISMSVVDVIKASALQVYDADEQIRVNVGGSSLEGEVGLAVVSLAHGDVFRFVSRPPPDNDVLYRRRSGHAWRKLQLNAQKMPEAHPSAARQLEPIPEEERTLVSNGLSRQEQVHLAV